MTTTPRWAWVAGASEGLGLAFADELALRGFSLVLIARRTALLTAEADRLTHAYGVDVIPYGLDLADPALADTLASLLADAPPAIAVYNAAHVPVGSFLDLPLATLLRVVDVNVRGPLLFARVLGEDMRRRGGGGLLLMSSLAGEQGSPRLAAYAASKAFNTRLAEGLWAELMQYGVDVAVCCAGAVRTPGLVRSGAAAPGTLEPREVARAALDRLGRGPRVVPGWRNAFGALLLGRWLPRSVAVRWMGRVTGNLEAPGSDG